MKTKLTLASGLGGIAALLLSFSASAQMGPGAGMGGMGGMGPGGGKGPGPRVADCSKAPDRARCEARNKALEACKDKLGPDHAKCMNEQSGGAAPGPRGGMGPKAGMGPGGGMGPGAGMGPKAGMGPGGGMGPGAGMGPGKGGGMGPGAGMGPGKGAGMGGMGGTGPGPRAADCSKAPDKARCEAHNKALAECGDQRGPEHAACMRKLLGPPPAKGGAAAKP